MIITLELDDTNWARLLGAARANGKTVQEEISRKFPYAITKIDWKVHEPKGATRRRDAIQEREAKKVHGS